MNFLNNDCFSGGGTDDGGGVQYSLNGCILDRTVLVKQGTEIRLIGADNADDNLGADWPVRHKNLA